MNADSLQEMLSRWQAGELDLPTLERLLRSTFVPTVPTAESQVDLDRAQRCGFPEVVFGTGKTPQAIVDVFQAQLQAGQNSLATRVTPEQAEFVCREIPDTQWNALARTLSLRQFARPVHGRVAVVTAGTSDRPVAEEAVETLRWMGCQTDLIIDVGVAGPHRLLAQRQRLWEASAIVVVAGMEGALPSVVAGWVAVPVIAVPTSVGYGANLGGVAALLSMLNSCAANVAVVNIDAGFKGGYLAGLIARQHSGKPE
jgi:pyridinium-3,5-biscarboxylic acid mononucleotide synthase